MSSSSPEFKAFISYSHAADGNLAPALQHAIQVFTKPWYALRACRVFRDQTTLVVTAELWPSIERALLSSEFFILLASPQAAASPWIEKEALTWCAHRDSKKMLIVLTDGEIAWDSSRGDFDWSRTNALPPTLEKKFAVEPLYLDLRWAKGLDQLSHRHPQFLDVIADIGCALWDLKKDDIIGREVREYRKTRRLIRAVVATLSVLTIAALTASALAVMKQREAVAALDVAERRRVQARGVAETILFEVHDRLQIAETAELRRMLLAKAAELLAALDNPTQDFRSRRADMVLHSRLAESAFLAGDEDKARTEYETALTIARQAANQDPMSAALRRDVSVNLVKLGELSLKRKDMTQAKKYFEEDMMITRELLQRAPDSFQYRLDLAISNEKIGDICRAEKDDECTIRRYDEDLDIMRELHRAYPTNLEVAAGLATAVAKNADFFLGVGDIPRAETLFAESLSLNRELIKDHRDNISILRNITVALLRLGDIAMRRGDDPTALGHYQEALVSRRNLLRLTSTDAARRDLAVVLGRVGVIFIRGKKYDRAIEHMEEAVRLEEALLGSAEDDLDLRRDIAVNTYEVAKPLIERKQFEAAWRHLLRGIEMYRDVTTKEPENLVFRHERFQALRRGGLVAMELKHSKESAELHGTACALAAEIPVDGVGRDAEIELILDLEYVGGFQLEHGNPEVAAAYIREAIRRMEILETRDPKLAKDREFRQTMKSLKKLRLSVQPGAVGE